MTPDEKQRLEWLCNLVATEKDPEKFQEYLTELNELLEAKQARLKPTQNDAA